MGERLSKRIDIGDKMRTAQRERNQAKEELENAEQKHKNGQRDMDRAKKELENAEQKHNDEMEKYTEKTNCTVCLESYINREPHILNPCGMYSAKNASNRMRQV